MAKYKSLAEVKVGFDSGSLNRDEHQLVLDNDCSFIYGNDGEEIFNGGGPEEIAEQALDLLGIPWTGA